MRAPAALGARARWVRGRWERRRWTAGRVATACGVVGPAAFTAAWVAATLRQPGYSVAVEHLSGLAALDARDPALMVGGFVTLGACTAAFGSAVETALGGAARAGAAPWLLRVAGVAAAGAGLLRRDTLLLDPPGAAGVPPSWHNVGHDLVSLTAYGCLLAVPLVLARRFRDDQALARLAPAAFATALVTAALLLLFWSRTVVPWNGVVQRAAVSVPLLAMAALALWLLGRPVADRRTTG